MPFLLILDDLTQTIADELRKKICANQREKKSALISEKEKNSSHADIRRLKKRRWDAEFSFLTSPLLPISPAAARILSCGIALVVAYEMDIVP